MSHECSWGGGTHRAVLVCSRLCVCVGVCVHARRRTRSSGETFARRKPGTICRPLSTQSNLNALEAELRGKDSKLQASENALRECEGAVMSTKAALRTMREKLQAALETVAELQAQVAASAAPRSGAASSAGSPAKCMSISKS